jgi:hypothetical protein
MHRRAEYSNILVSLDTFTIGKQQQWLASQQEKKKEKIAREKASKATHQIAKYKEKE